MTLKGITRRDFLNGSLLGIAAGMAPAELFADAPGGDYYPPLATGLRGDHAGSFEIAHALARAGRRWPRPDGQTDADYDLVVVGGGISGLASAFYWQRARGASARILVLDNHDDIGGHAKRNEFVVDGRRLISYGGSQSIDTPGKYSRAARQLLIDIGIHVDRFYEYFDGEFADRFGLRAGIHFRHEIYGRDVVLPDVSGSWNSMLPDDLGAVLAATPLEAAEREALGGLLAGGRDWLAGLSAGERIDVLCGSSYSDFLARHASVPPRVIRLLRDTIKGYWGAGWDALSALEALRVGAAGTAAMAAALPGAEEGVRDEPYIFHFPDGNAAVARALLRRLLPEVLPGGSMEDLVTAPLDYDRLDRAGEACRIRLNSTAIDVRHAGETAVDVTYLQGGRPRRVRGRHAILACWNHMLPHLCPELPAEQKAALEWPEKVPLVYLSIAMRHWRPFAELGFRSFYVPESALMHSFGLDFPVSLGDYRFTSGPDEPTVIHGSFVPTLPDQGLTTRQQHVAGRHRLFDMTFDDFESAIVDQMSGALGAQFDAERDLAAITVNRWPHGYAYEYNDYSDPPEWNPENGPHVAGRAKLGRISIANADSQAYAFVDGAIDAAARASGEQLG